MEHIIGLPSWSVHAFNVSMVFTQVMFLSYSNNNYFMYSSQEHLKGSSLVQNQTKDQQIFSFLVDTFSFKVLLFSFRYLSVFTRLFIITLVILMLYRYFCGELTVDFNRFNGSRVGLF